MMNQIQLILPKIGPEAATDLTQTRPATLCWQDIEHPILVRYSKRAKRVQIVASQQSWVLVLPMGVTHAEIAAFLKQAFRWIQRQYAKTQRQQNNPPAWPMHLNTGATVLWQGHHYPLLYHPSARFVVVSDTQHIMLHGPNTGRAAWRVLVEWMQGQVRTQVEHWVSIYSTSIGQRPRRINLRAQQSRWGSLGIHNDMQINWLLGMAPPEVLEYVVVHEMAHLRYRSHGPRFWALVERCLPTYNQGRDWLRHHGGRLTPPPHR